jgi:hypothetical protein
MLLGSTLFLSLSVSGSSVDYDAIITNAHVRGAVNVHSRLLTWRHPFNPIINASNCSGDLGGGNAEAAIAAFVINDNATEVQLASEYIGAKSACVGGFFMCEWSRALVLAQAVGRPSSFADTQMKDNALKFLSDNAVVNQADLTTGDPMRQVASENLDMVRRQTSYIMAQVLVEDPAYASRPILLPGSPGKSIGTVQEHYVAWESFFYAQLKERATRGLFVELASNNYWYVIHAVHV